MLCALILCLAGCTTFGVVPLTDADSLAGKLELGDDVRITKSDGTKVSFEIDYLDAETVAGEGYRIPRADIAELQLRQPDRAATTTALLLAAGVLYVFAVVEDDVDDIVDAIN